MGGQIISSVKYADDLVTVERRKALQDMFDKLIEIGRCYGMERYVEERVMRISRQAFPAKIMVEQIQLENVESFKCLGSILKMMVDVLVKLHVGLPCLNCIQKRRGLFLLAHGTSN